MYEPWINDKAASELDLKCYIGENWTRELAGTVQTTDIKVDSDNFSQERTRDDLKNRL